MPWRGDGSSGYFLSDNDEAIWNLPDGDWCWLTSLKFPVGNNAGTGTQYILSFGNYGGTNSLSLLIYEDSWSTATAQGEIEALLEDSAGVAFGGGLFDATMNLNPDTGDEVLVVVQRRDAERMMLGMTRLKASAPMPMAV